MVSRPRHRALPTTALRPVTNEPGTMKTLFRLTFVGLCLLLAGCSHYGEYGVENAGTKTLNDVAVVTDSGHRFRHGILIPSASKSFGGGMPMKAMNKFTLSWTDSVGERHEAVIDISRRELRDNRVPMLIINDAMSVEKGWVHRENY